MYNKPYLLYGKLSDLEWQDSEGVPYASFFKQKMISNINIVYEKVNSTKLKKSIIRDSDTTISKLYSFRIYLNLRN